MAAACCSCMREWDHHTHSDVKLRQESDQNQLIEMYNLASNHQHLSHDSHSRLPSRCSV